MLAIAGLCKRYGARVILNQLALDVAAGELVAIVGESGAGKSTLLNLIAGLELPDAGRVAINGKVMSDLSEDERAKLRRRSIGFVFQAFHILPHLTLARNVMLPLVLLGTAAAERTERTRVVLAAVGLADRGDSMPAELSGGELQRVALARALVHKPALVLADEPTGNLDTATADAALKLIVATVRANGAAAIVATHSERAAGHADRVLRLAGGTIA